MAGTTRAELSIIVPAYNAARTLEQTLNSIRNAGLTSYELIVADDASIDETAAIAERIADKVVRRPCQAGAARVRNDAVEHAQGVYVLFVDADVSVSPSAVQGILGHLRSGVDAVFGAYTALPPEEARNAPTDYKNILHHWTHLGAAGTASTFWSGFGAIRRDVFVAVDGFFPEATRSADVEDIQLGIRLRKAGYSVTVDPTLQVRHHKRFTMRSLVRTDIQHRAIPWTHAMLDERALVRDLNLKPASLGASAIACLAILSMLIGLLYRPAFLGVPVLLAAWLLINRRFLHYCARTLGVSGAAKCAGLHLLAGLYGPVGALLGAGFWLLRRRNGSSRNTLSIQRLPRAGLDHRCRVTVCLAETPYGSLGDAVATLPERAPWWEVIAVGSSAPPGLLASDTFIRVAPDTTHTERVHIALTRAAGAMFAPLGSYLLPSAEWIDAIRDASYRNDLAIAGPIDVAAGGVLQRARAIARWWDVRPTQRASWGFIHSPGNIAFDTEAARQVGGFQQPGALVYRLAGFGANPIRFEPKMLVQADPSAHPMSLLAMAGVGRLQASYTVRYFDNGLRLRIARASAVAADAFAQIVRTPITALSERVADRKFWLAYPLAIPGILSYHAGLAFGALRPRPLVAPAPTVIDVQAVEAGVCEPAAAS